MKIKISKKLLVESNFDRIREIDRWLISNCGPDGARDTFSGGPGYIEIEIDDAELALLFKLKFQL